MTQDLKKKVQFTKCPLCDGPLVWDNIELMPGAYARAQVCHKCKEEYLTLEENERARREYYSKAFGL